MDAIFDTYAQVGDILPRLKEFEKVFENYPSLLEVLERYICDVLEFHAAALKVFARPGECPLGEIRGSGCLLLTLSLQPGKYSFTPHGTHSSHGSIPSSRA